MDTAAFRRSLALCRLLFCLGLPLGVPVAGQPLFTDVTDAMWPAFPEAAYTVAVGDVDNDGWPDLYTRGDFGNSLENLRKFALLLNQEGGRFAKRTDLFEAPFATEHKGMGSLLGDVDNDGDLDLYMTLGSYGAPIPDRLLRNDRGRFEDITQEGEWSLPRPTDNAVWLDYNRDGYLDIYAGHWHPASICIGCGQATGSRRRRSWC